MAYCSFSSELNRIENELNSKCDKLIQMVVMHQKQMQSKLTSIRENYNRSEDPDMYSRLRAKFVFDINPIISVISSAMELELVLLENKPPPKIHAPMRVEDFRLPKGLAVHSASGRIYVADMGNECVKVCEAAGNVLDSIGEGTLREPYGLLLVSKALYVTDMELNSLLVFDVTAKTLLGIAGKKDKSTDGLSQPKGLALDQDEFIYVCDSGNDRVVIYTTKLEFVKPLSWDSIKNPLNVAFSNKKMYLLCDSNPCLFIMNSDGQQSALISNGYEYNVMSTGFFCVDSEERILISCYGGVVYVFDKNARRLGSRNIAEHSCCYGLAVNSAGNIVVVSTKPSAINFFKL